jgi:two-component system, chemotaxis family, protein-glutamate methylesterase/glutaminase
MSTPRWMPARFMLAKYVVGVAASAGGLAALSRLLGQLPAGFPASLLVVQHLPPTFPSHLVEILGRRTTLMVLPGADGASLLAGTVYISPPDVHLILASDRRMRLSHSPPTHHCRPSADRLFTSFGSSFGRRAIAVVLTGSGCDGAEGAQAMRRQGGTVVVQDERSAEFPGMPRAALQAGAVDWVLPLDDIPTALQRLVGKALA